MSLDQRRSVRMKTFLKGRVHFNNGLSSMDCLIRDLSATGARLELSQTVTLPEVFELYIPNKDASYRATLRWRTNDGVGVTFDDAAAKPAPEPPAPEPAKPAPPPVAAAPEPAPADASLSVLLRRITELEAENAALRSVLASMGRSSAA